MKNFEKIVAPTVQQLFMQQIMNSFLSGEIQPGEKLPTERALAEQMGISKTVVHTGLKALEKMGFVEMKPQSGVYALDYMKHGNLDTFTAIVRFSSEQMSYELIRSFTDLLLTIDNMAFQLFVEKSSDKSGEIRELDRQVDRIGVALTDPGLPILEKAKKMERLHYTFGLYSGSAVLPFMMNTMQEPAEYVWENCIRSAQPENLINVADGIVRALEEGSSAKAYTILEDATNRYLKRVPH